MDHFYQLIMVYLIYFLSIYDISNIYLMNRKDQSRQVISNLQKVLLSFNII